MAQKIIDQKEYTSLIKRIKYLEKMLALPTASLMARVTQGVISSPAYVLPANENNFTFIDGMNITIDLDSPMVMIDCTLATTLNFSTGTLKFVVEIDGQIDEVSSIYHANATTARRIYYLLYEVLPGAGRHQYRLMVSSTVAGTMTCSEKARTMRAAGLIYNRRRFTNVNRT